MDDIFVGRIMSTDLHTVSSETLVEDAAQTLLENDISSVLVVDEDDVLEGILTTTDFVDIVAKSQPKAETSVSRYMTTDVMTTTAQEPICDVAETMVDQRFHHMPVVDDEEGVIGMVTTADLAGYLSDPELITPTV